MHFLDDLQSVLDDLGARLDDHFMRKSSQQLAKSKPTMQQVRWPRSMFEVRRRDKPRRYCAKVSHFGFSQVFAEVRHFK